jgi:hypothetical protein
MFETWESLLDQVRRLAKNTSVDPNSRVYELQGSFLTRLPDRLGFLAQFLKDVNEKLESESKPKTRQQAKSKKDDSGGSDQDQADQEG